MRKVIFWLLLLFFLLGVGTPVFFYFIRDANYADGQAGAPSVEMAAAQTRCQSHGGTTQGDFAVDLLVGSWQSLGANWGDVRLQGNEGTYSQTATNARQGKLTLFAQPSNGHYFAFFHEIARYPAGSRPPADEQDKYRGSLYFYLCADGQAIEGVSRASEDSVRDGGVFVPLSWSRL